MSNEQAIYSTFSTSRLNILNVRITPDTVRVGSLRSWLIFLSVLVVAFVGNPYSSMLVGVRLWLLETYTVRLKIAPAGAVGALL
jgi:hypothetical protein